MDPEGQEETQARHSRQPQGRGSSTRRGISVKTVISRWREPNWGVTRRLFLPIHPIPAFLGHMLVGNMGKLFFPIDDLGCGNRQRIPSAALDKICSLESQFIEQNIDPLIMKKIELGRAGYHVFQNPIGKMKDHGNSPVQPL